MKFASLFNSKNDKKVTAKDSKGESRFFTPDDIYNEVYYQTPTVLYSEEYIDMDAEALKLYIYFRGLTALSLSSKWVDENTNRIYFICTNETIRKKFHWGKDKIGRIKRELEKYGLLCQERQGFKKPNKLFLLHPVVTAEDVYIPSDKKDIDSQVKTVRTAHQLDDVKDERSSDSVQTQVNSDHCNDTEIKNNEAATNYFNIFTKSANNLMALIARNANTDLDVDEIQQLILKAKGKAVYENGFSIGSALDVKDFPILIKTTLRGVIKRMKTEKVKIRSLKGYIYQAFHKGFAKIASAYTHYVDTLGLDDLMKSDSLENTLTNYVRNAPELNLQL